MARLCELLGANIEHVRKGIGTDSRIGFPFLFPGPGYGGSCFPKDVQALIQTAAEVGYDLKLSRAVEDVNAAQKHRLAEKVTKKFGQNLAGRVFCLWGLAFKPNTDDIREAPALVIIEDLLARGAKIHASDPEAIESTRRVLGNKIQYFERNYDALNGADALILVTEWNEFRRPNFALIKERLKQPVIFDGRNVYDRKTLESQGFEYHGIGL
jgi:UDPglucose 6-dehydrogenase